MQSIDSSSLNKKIISPKEKPSIQYDQNLLCPSNDQSTNSNSENEQERIEIPERFQQIYQNKDIINLEISKLRYLILEKFISGVFQDKRKNLEQLDINITKILFNLDKRNILKISNFPKSFNKEQIENIICQELEIEEHHKNYIFTIDSICNTNNENYVTVTVKDTYYIILLFIKLQGKIYDSGTQKQLNITYKDDVVYENQLYYEKESEESNKAKFNIFEYFENYVYIEFIAKNKKLVFTGTSKNTFIEIIKI